MRAQTVSGGSKLTLEEKVFRCRRFIFDRLESSGFVKGPDGYVCSREFMNGDFEAIFTVKENGEYSCKVIDRMNDEEYSQINNENYDGAYVNTVRSSLEKLLEGIAKKCCREVLFASDQGNRICEKIFEKYSVRPDFPWKDNKQERYHEAGVFRHKDNDKWFALMMNININAILHDGNNAFADVMNLKIDPSRYDEVHRIRNVFPAYHMSHKMWISVILNEVLSDEEVMSLIDMSYDMTKKKGK